MSDDMDKRVQSIMWIQQVNKMSHRKQKQNI